MVTSKPESTVTIDGVERGCISAEAHFSFKSSPATSTLVIQGKFDVGHDQPVVWTLDGQTRFTGLVRDFDRDVESQTTIYANSPDTRLVEYQNHQDPGHWGGLTIADLTGSTSATGGTIIKAVLDTVGVSYNPSNIGDNGVTLNYFQIEEPFIWSADTDPNGIGAMQGPGETALDYINKIASVMAVADVGFYRFFPTTGGDLYLYLVGGRPRSSPDFTFTEGIDILTGKATRRYPTANAVFVSGFNFGDGGPDGSGSPEFYLTDPETNPFMSTSNPFVYKFSSALIERSNDSDPGGGMSCQTVANAIMPDVNRETVNVSATVFTSAYLGPGQTILIQGNLGGEPGNMGVGEKLWLQDLTIRFDGDGVTQSLELIGGGLPDDASGTPPI